MCGQKSRYLQHIFVANSDYNCKMRIYRLSMAVRCGRWLAIVADWENSAHIHHCLLDLRVQH